MANQNYDPNDQSSWVGSAGNTGRETFPQSGGQYPGSAPMTGQTNEGGGLLGGALSGVRQNIEAQMGGLIDHYAGQVPGGHQFSPEAKQAVSGILDNLQRQLENQAANRLGGMGGGLFGENQGNTGNSGSQL
jgi:hypothetical protein